MARGQKKDGKRDGKKGKKRDFRGKENGAKESREFKGRKNGREESEKKAKPLANGEEIIQKVNKDAMHAQGSEQKTAQQVANKWGHGNIDWKTHLFGETARQRYVFLVYK